jgi:hypothetical protein
MMTPAPTTLKARVLIYALGAHKVFIKRVVVETSKRPPFPSFSQTLPINILIQPFCSA